MNKTKIKIDKFLLIFIIIFAIISLFTIFSASIYLSPSLGNLVLKQAMWYIIGFLFIAIILRFNIEFFIKFAPYIYIINIILLIGLLFIAPSINGSKCWYIIKGIGSFQPSEFMKISLILMETYVIKKFFNKYKKTNLKQEFKLIIYVFLIFLIPSILTFLEPDTGAVIVYFIITLSILFISGIKLRWFIIFFIIILCCSTLFFLLYFFEKDIFINILGSDFFYRIDRIINWKSGSGMQLENSLAAIGSSNLLGHGFNKTPIYFPEAGTDFIFTVFSSNFGLFGSVALIIYIILFNLRIINIAKTTTINYNKYILIGILSIFLYQQVQNISMTIGLLPITGITLPFISYGGSSLLSYMILMGLIFCIYNKKEITN